MITLELYELKNLCMQMSELGAANYAKRVTPAKDSISQREAYRTFGEARVKRWVSMHLVNPIRSGNATRSKFLYSMAELLAVDTSEKLNGIINK
jgi:hypothetical protein